MKFQHASLPLWAALTAANPLRQTSVMPRDGDLEIDVGSTIGNPDRTDAPMFSDEKYEDGVFPESLEARSENGKCVSWLKVGWTDGSVTEHGKLSAESNRNFGYGKVEWDPWNHQFQEFALWQTKEGSDSEIGRMRVTIHGQVLDVGRDNNLAGRVDMSKGRGKGMLLGFDGYASNDCIVGLRPMFTMEKPKKLVLRDVKFTPTFEELNQRPFDDRMMKVVRATTIVVNDRSDGDTEQSVDLYLVTEHQDKITYNHQGGGEKGGEAGATIGVEGSFSMGLPFLFFIDGKTKFDVSGKYIQKDYDVKFNGNEKTDIERVQTRYTVKANVAPGQKAMCHAVAIQSKLDLEFSAKLAVTFENGASFEFPAGGKFEQATSTDAIQGCEDYDASKIPGTANAESPGPEGKEHAGAIKEIHGSGTYCNDGRRVGDVGMSNEALRAACPV